MAGSATVSGAAAKRLCTAGTQAASTSSQCAHSGLWGLARACRQELPQLPAWCLDVQHGGLHHIQSSVLHSRTLRLPSGIVRGLRLSSSIEPEAALVAATLRVPRLVAPYCVQATAIAASVASMHRQLDVHTSRAMAVLDARRLSRAYALLEALCQQHVSGVMRTIRQASVPMWHHKLLLAWCAEQSPPLSDGAVTPADVRAAHPDLWPEVQLAERCGPHLMEALSGAVAYQELLFPGGSMEAVLPVYENAVGSAYYNGCVVAAVEAIVALLLESHDVAASAVVLEVGAGTGGTASSVLPVLDNSCERYVFTDVSEVFLRWARTHFSDFPFLECALLNVDADPRLQGFASRMSGVTIATNVLHATPFMRRTLLHCRLLLRPGGMLVINEALQASAFGQITFGLTDGWWLFAESRDPERVGQASPLLS